MAGIETTLLDGVLAHVASKPVTSYDALAQDLRATFSGRQISVCGEDDISPRIKPVAENAVCLLYLVASGEHCLSLTNDAEAATGIVVALRGEDD